MNGFKKIEEGLKGDNELLREGIKDVKSLIILTSKKERWKKKQYSKEAIIEGLFQEGLFGVSRTIGCFEDLKKGNEDEDKVLDVFLNECESDYIKKLEKLTGVEVKTAQSPYSSPIEENTPEQTKFKKAAYIVIEEFCDYLINLDELSSENSSLINEFIEDMYSAFGAFEGSHVASCQVQSPSAHFTSIESLFLYDSYCPEGISKNLFIVFGLRQALEMKFRKILGVASIENGLKVPHDLFPYFIIKTFPAGAIENISNRDIELIMKIYKWTNYSIHSMWRVPSWMLWKALSFCKPFLEGDFDKINVNHNDYYKILIRGLILLGVSY